MKTKEVLSFMIQTAQSKCQHQECLSLFAQQINKTQQRILVAMTSMLRMPCQEILPSARQSECASWGNEASLKAVVNGCKLVGIIGYTGQKWYPYACYKVRILSCLHNISSLQFLFESQYCDMDRTTVPGHNTESTQFPEYIATRHLFIASEPASTSWTEIVLTPEFFYCKILTCIISLPKCSLHGIQLSNQEKAKALSLWDFNTEGKGLKGRTNKGINSLKFGWTKQESRDPWYGIHGYCDTSRQHCLHLVMDTNSSQTNACDKI